MRQTHKRALLLVASPSAILRTAIGARSAEERRIAIAEKKRVTLKAGSASFQHFPLTHVSNLWERVPRPDWPHQPPSDTWYPVIQQVISWPSSISKNAHK